MVVIGKLGQPTNNGKDENISYLFRTLYSRADNWNGLRRQFP